MPMISSTIKSFSIGLIFLIILLFGTGCEPSISENNTPASAFSPPSQIQAPTPQPGLESRNIRVQLPSGWARVDQPDLRWPTRHVEGIVAFNSWGEPDFYAAPVRTDSRLEYGVQTIMPQVKDGGAYVILHQVNGPPTPTEHLPAEYVRDDLSSLWRPFVGPPAPVSINFYKRGHWLELVIACSPTVSDDTITQLNILLSSWRFE